MITSSITDISGRGLGEGQATKPERGSEHRASGLIGTLGLTFVKIGSAVSAATSKSLKAGRQPSKRTRVRMGVINGAITQAAMAEAEIDPFGGSYWQ
jgi:hypothetical protein